MFSWPTVWNSVIFGWVVESQQLQFTLDTHPKQVSSGSGSSRVNCVECFCSKSDNSTKESCRYSLSVCVWLFQSLIMTMEVKRFVLDKPTKLLQVLSTKQLYIDGTLKHIQSLVYQAAFPIYCLEIICKLIRIPIWIHPVTINFDNITQNKWISWRG